MMMMMIFCSILTERGTDDSEMMLISKHGRKVIGTEEIKLDLEHMFRTKTATQALKINESNSEVVLFSPSCEIQ